MASKAGFYGSDAKENKFRVPDFNGTGSQNESYFVLVEKLSGKKELYNNDLNTDKFAGHYENGGEFEPNENWWGNAQAVEKDFFNNDKGKELINNHASTVALKGKLDEGKGIEQAQVETNELVKICEYLSPILFPKNPETKEPINGKKTIAYSILSF